MSSKWRREEKVDEEVQDFEWQKQKRQERFKNKKKDRKRYDTDKLFDDRYENDDDESWENDE